MFSAYEECKVNLTDTACNQLANICILQANSLGACDLLDDSMGSLMDADGRNMGWIEKMPFIGGLEISGFRQLSQKGIKTTFAGN